MWHCKSIFLNLTNLCNVRCKKCITPRVIRKHGELSKELLYFILNLLESHNFNGVIRCGVGENLIYSHIDFLIKELSIRNSPTKFEILTNGLAFPIEKEIFYNNPAIKWGVTLDGMTQDDLKGLQLGLDINSVKQKLFQIKCRHPECNMYLNYTLHNKNINHLLDFIKMCLDLNVGQIFVTPLKVFENHYTAYLSELIPDLSLHFVQSLFSEIRQIANQNKIQIHLPETSKKFRPCSLTGNYSPIIDIDGAVSFCTGHENKRIGNVVDPHIGNIWKKMRMRTRFEKRISNFCKNCLNLNNSNKRILSMPAL